MRNAEAQYDEEISDYSDEDDEGSNAADDPNSKKDNKPATMREMLMRFGAVGNFGFQIINMFLVGGPSSGSFSKLSGGKQIGRSCVYASGFLGAGHSPVVVYKERQLTQEDTFRTALNGIREEQSRLADANDDLSAEIDDLQSEVDRMKDVERALKELAGTQGSQLEELMGLIEENKEINRCLRVVLKNKCVEDVITLVLDIDNDGSFTIQNKEIQRLIIGMNIIDEISSFDEKMFTQEVLHCGGHVDEVIALIKKMIHGSGEKHCEGEEGGNDNGNGGNSTRCTIEVGDPEEYLNKHRSSYRR